MAHSSEMTWDEISGRVAIVAGNIVKVLLDAEEEYQEMLEIFNYAGGTDTLMAGLLFATGTPDQTQIDKTTDLKNAMAAAHQLYQAAANVAISQNDRFASLRRMS